MGGDCSNSASEMNLRLLLSFILIIRFIKKSQRHSSYQILRRLGLMQRRPEELTNFDQL